MLLTEVVIEKLGLIAQRVRPVEAVGLVLPGGRIIELPNRSLNATESFVTSGGDIRLALEVAHIEMTELDWAETVLWHSHPGGGIGPSRVDMRNRVEGLRHLVITLAGDDVIPTFY